MPLLPQETAFGCSATANPPGATQRHRPERTLSETAFQRFLFASAFFASSLTTERFMLTGTTRYAPSSTAFWMISSILSPFGSPWNR